MEVKQFHNYNNETLYGYHFGCDSPVARIFILEGMEEHGKRYEHFANALNEYHFDVYVIDTYGQGENVNQGAPRGVWPVNGFNKYVQFVAEVIEDFNKDGVETYIFAHSMGSFMAQRFLEYAPKLVHKVVLCGSGCQNPGLGVGHFLAKRLVNNDNRNTPAGFLGRLMFGNFNKKIKQPRTKFDWLSYNSENVDTYIADPLCGFGSNKGFCLDFLNGMVDTYKADNLARLDIYTKIFIICGKDDPVSNYGRSVDDLRKMFNYRGVYNISSKIYGNHRHEILHEDDKELIYKDIIQFFLS